MIVAENLSHFYGKEQVLYDVDLYIQKGAFVTLSGESGSGKSTLLSILSTLLAPTRGVVKINGNPVDQIGDIDMFRQHNIGFVFQFHYLINYLTVYDNIALAALPEKKEKIEQLLEQLGIIELNRRYPDQLSGGQRQRVAVARAMINDPKLLFADEPTGSLDSENSKIVYELLRDASNQGTTVVVASHDQGIGRYADTMLEMSDGRIV